MSLEELKNLSQEIKEVRDAAVDTLKLPEPSQEQSDFIDLVLRSVQQTGPKVHYLTGKAGTGKTVTIEHLKNHLERYRISYEVCAFTGSAALNAGGVTLHRLLGLVTTDNVTNVIYKKSKKLEYLDVLIIDEISMVRADMLDMLDTIAQNSRFSSRAFGDLIVVMVGDPLQLPPVVTTNERAFINQTYGNPFFFSSKVFSDLLEKDAITFTCLSEVFRQKDAEFIGLLNNIRDSDNVSEVVSKINSFIIEHENFEESTILVKSNKAKDKINKLALAKLPGESRIFEAELSNKDVPAHKLSCPLKVEFKIGSRVMCIKNMYDGGDNLLVANGDLGTVVDMDEDSITVDLPRLKETRSLSSIKFSKLYWEETAHFYDKERGLVPKTLTSVKAIPFVLANAITVHKAQGKTLDEVCIDLREGMGDPGMFYTAISRLRSLEGLSILGRFTKFGLNQCPHVAKFNKLTVGR